MTYKEMKTLSIEERYNLVRNILDCVKQDVDNQVVSKIEEIKDEVDGLYFVLENHGYIE